MSQKSSILASPVFALLLIIASSVRGQKSTDNWYFGVYGGLNFSNTTPVILNNSAMFSIEGCATISDDSGNLLFYTEGDTIWNKLHQPMANGMGLIGNSSTSQGSLIIKKPSSQAEYIVFTLDEMASANGLHYSVVNSTLAAGLGSVTTKNTPLLTIPCSEKMTATKHCNGADYWVLVHEYNSTNFHAFLLSSSGVSLTAVISPVGSNHVSQEWLGCMKLSPNGKKLAVCSYNTPSRVEIFDFNSSTGAVTAPMSFTLPFAYGCEFSTDGTKLYVSGSSASPSLFQWDLCNTNTIAILASQFTQTVSASIGAMQLANNGKIYVASQNQQCLGVVNFPNNSGVACSYSACGQSIAPKNTYASIPNFPSSFFRQPVPAFTYSRSAQSCQTYSFYSQAFSLPTSCPSTSYSSVLWNFDDPITASLNTSNLNSPTHTFSDSGSYLVRAYYAYACGLDSVSVLVHVTQKSPSLGISPSFTICKGESTTLAGTGAASYYWNTGDTTNSIFVTPIINTTYSLTGYNFEKTCSNTKQTSVFVSNCTTIRDWNLDDEFFLFPIPASETIHFKTSFQAQFSIYNCLGTPVYYGSSAIGTNSLNIQTFQPGIYILIFKDSSGQMHKFVKQ